MLVINSTMLLGSNPLRYMKEVRPITPKPIMKNPIAHRRIKLFNVVKVPIDIKPNNSRIQMAVIPTNIIKINVGNCLMKISVMNSPIIDFPTCCSLIILASEKSYSTGTP